MPTDAEPAATFPDSARAAGASARVAAEDASRLLRVTGRYRSLISRNLHLHPDRVRACGLGAPTATHHAPNSGVTRLRGSALRGRKAKRQLTQAPLPSKLAINRARQSSAPAMAGETHEFPVLRRRGGASQRSAQVPCRQIGQREGPRGDEQRQRNRRRPVAQDRRARLDRAAGSRGTRRARAFGARTVRAGRREPVARSLRCRSLPRSCLPPKHCLQAGRPSSRRSGCRGSPTARPPARWRWGKEPSQPARGRGSR